MNKPLSKLSLLLMSCLLITGCVPNTNSSTETNNSSMSTTENTSQSFIPADELVIDQPVVELETHGDVNIGENECYERVRVFNNTYYFQVLNRKISQSYPTVRQYKMDLRDGTISLLKERDPNREQRVWDFLEFDGVLYESVILPGEDKLYNAIYADGKEIWKEEAYAIPCAPLFAIDHGHLLCTTTGTDELGIKNAVYRIDSDQTMTPIWKSGAGTEFTYLTFPANTNDGMSKLVFQSTLNGKPVVVIVDSNGYETVEFDKKVIRFQSLGDEIVMFSRKKELSGDGGKVTGDLSEYMEMECHALNLSTHEIYPVQIPYNQIGNKNVGAGAQDSFLFYHADEKVTYKAKLVDRELKIEKVPDVHPGIPFYFRVNDKVALFNSDDSVTQRNDWSKVHFYLVDMQ